MSQDQTAHLTRTKDMSTRAAYEQVTRLMHAHKVAMAWSETARAAASSTRFDREIVEADSARFSKRKEVDEQGKPVRVHNGRTLVLKGRRTKSWLASGMTLSTSRGVKGMPRETCEEVQGLLQKKLGTGTVFAPDGAQAWESGRTTDCTGDQKACCKRVCMAICRAVAMHERQQLGWRGTLDCQVDIGPSSRKQYTHSVAEAGEGQRCILRAAASARPVCLEFWLYLGEVGQRTGQGQQDQQASLAERRLAQSWHLYTHCHVGRRCHRCEH